MKSFPGCTLLPATGPSAAQALPPKNPYLHSHVGAHGSQGVEGAGLIPQHDRGLLGLEGRENRTWERLAHSPDSASCPPPPAGLLPSYLTSPGSSKARLPPQVLALPLGQRALLPGSHEPASSLPPASAQLSHRVPCGHSEDIAGFLLRSTHSTPALCALLSPGTRAGVTL